MYKMYYKMALIGWKSCFYNSGENRTNMSCWRSGGESKENLHVDDQSKQVLFLSFVRNFLKEIENTRGSLTRKSFLLCDVFLN